MLAVLLAIAIVIIIGLIIYIMRIRNQLHQSADDLDEQNKIKDFQLQSSEAYEDLKVKVIRSRVTVSCRTF